jgi:hypothetical protein
MSRRKDAKALVRRDDGARQWATATGRALALDLYFNRETATLPYGVGVVLDAGEKVWAQVPVRFNLDRTPPVTPGEHTQPAFRSLLVTTNRVVGRLADDRLHGYRWDKAVGARVDLTPGREVVSLDIDIESEPTLIWTGPAVAPVAVAVVFHLFGSLAMIQRPGLAAVRVEFSKAGPNFPQPRPVEWSKIGCHRQKTLDGELK